VGETTSDWRQFGVLSVEACPGDARIGRDMGGGENGQTCSDGRSIRLRACRGVGHVFLHLHLSFCLSGSTVYSVAAASTAVVTVSPWPVMSCLFFFVMSCFTFYYVFPFHIIRFTQVNCLCFTAAPHHQSPHHSI